MSIDCTAEYLGEASKCYCFDPITTEKVKVYLLAQIAGLSSMEPAALADAADCYCFDKETMKKVQAYLLCQIANGSSPAPAECSNIEGAGDPT